MNDPAHALAGTSPPHGRFAPAKCSQSKFFPLGDPCHEALESFRSHFPQAEWGPWRAGVLSVSSLLHPHGLAPAPEQQALKICKWMSRLPIKDCCLFAKIKFILKGPKFVMLTSCHVSRAYWGSNTGLLKGHHPIQSAQRFCGVDTVICILQMMPSSVRAMK